MRLCSCRSPHRSGPGIMPRASHGSAEAKTAISRLTDYTRGFVKPSSGVLGARITNIGSLNSTAVMKGASGRPSTASAAGGGTAAARRTRSSLEARQWREAAAGDPQSHVASPVVAPRRDRTSGRDQSRCDYAAAGKVGTLLSGANHRIAR